MSGDSQKLLELAERCEKAEGPDRILDVEIATVISGINPEAFRPALEQIGVPGSGWTPGKEEWPCYTASLDAALMLVPKGGNFMLMRDDLGNCWAECGEAWQYEGKTLALALCAAALRARATI